MGKPVLTFLHFPKTGGSTIVYLLRRSFGIRHVDVEPMRGHSSVITSEDLRLVAGAHPFGVRCMAGHGFRMDEDYSSSGFDPQIFTMVRDPVELKLSWAQYRVEKQRIGRAEDAVEFLLKKGGRNPQTSRIAGEENFEKAVETIEENIRFVGRTEKFDLSMERMAAEFGEFPVDIRYRRKNAASSSTFKEEIRAKHEVMERLRERHLLDLKLCDYVDRRFLGIDGSRDGRPDLKIGHPMPSVSVGANRIYRNLVYKPAVAIGRKR